MRKLTLTFMLFVAIAAIGQDRQRFNLPVIQTKYTADPAPYVHGDTVYLYTTHDEDDAEGFKMKDWLLYTSTDMVNWQDHGAVASLRDFPWYKGNNGAWAECVVERDGKWYMYCPIHGNGIGVPIPHTVLSRMCWVNLLSGDRSTGMTLTRRCGLMTMAGRICIGAIRIPTALSSMRI